MLSVHSLASGFPTSGFATQEVGLEAVSAHIVGHVWSPIIWAGNSRTEDNFACSAFCVLDYDEGPTIAEVKQMLAAESLAYILGPTKSHQIEKSGKPACDRFRVVLRFSDLIWDADTFRWNMKRAIAKFGSDAMAYDSARIWQPCSSITDQQLSGGSFAVDVEVPEEETRAFRNAKAEQWATWRRENKVLPPAALRFLRGKVLAGNRNQKLYFAAIALFEFGKTVDEARRLLKASPSAQGLEGFEDTLRSAAKRAGATYER